MAIWMSDRQLYTSYRQASNKKHQLSILAQVNGCEPVEIEKAIRRHINYIRERDHSYRMLLARIEELRKSYSSVSYSYKKGTEHSMASRNSEPITGVKSKSLKSSGVKKSKSGKNISQWEKKTTIVNDYDIDWNNWIDSMNMHLEMAKECENQLKRLEKLYSSHK